MNHPADLPFFAVPDHLAKLSAGIEEAARGGRDLALTFRRSAMPPPEAYRLSAVVEQAATHEAERLQVAAYVVACAADCSILDLLPRLVHEQRKVGPATPAPEGSLDRHRLVVDGVPTWEGGWDRATDITDEIAFGKVVWEWRERWLADPERFAR